MWLYVIACLSVSFSVSWGTTWLVRRRAAGWGLIDIPADRKVHTEPTPLGGGIGIWLGVVLPLAVVHCLVWLATRSETVSSWVPFELRLHIDGAWERSGLLWSVILAGTVLAVMGLVDDFRGLPWQPRLCVQFLVAVALVACGVRATVFLPAPWLGQALSVCWLLVLINAFNFLDNMDGLLTGIALIASVLFAIIMLGLTGEARWLVAGVLLILSGALAGFLCFNRPPATIFMGDSGSYFVGLILASMTVLGTFYDRSAGTGRHVMLAPLCILALPLYDFCSVMFIRLRQGRSPFRADKSHFSHRLVELGLSPQQAVRMVYLVTLTTGLGALLLYEVDSWLAAGVVGLLEMCLLGIVAVFEAVGRQSVD
jgi:UDP-GlcNAc:undecaprenyl-phosphate GlcNAc-1-phosphate transferase